MADVVAPEEALNVNLDGLLGEKAHLAGAFQTAEERLKAVKDRPKDEPKDDPAAKFEIARAEAHVAELAARAKSVSDQLKALDKAFEKAASAA